MSTLGSGSGAFNNELQEDDDDLRVPCDLSSTISTSSSLDEISPVFKKVPTVSVSSTSASLVSKDRKFSDFLQFMDEEVLSEMTSVVPMTSTSTTSLDSDWLNKAFQAEDFAGLLASSSSFSAPASLMDLEVSSSPSSPSSSMTHDITAVDFESLIDLSLELDSAPVVASTEPVFAAPAPTSSKKRGRPSSKNEVAASPGPKKQRSSEPATPATPATPKPHPLSKPQNDDPEELERYTKYRASNNVAACQSRLRRKERERENSERVTVLEAQNAELKKELASLQGECGKLKALLETFLAGQQKK